MTSRTGATRADKKASGAFGYVRFRMKQTNGAACRIQCHGISDAEAKNDCFIVLTAIESYGRKPDVALLVNSAAPNAHNQYLTDPGSDLVAEFVAARCVWLVMDFQSESKVERRNPFDYVDGMPMMDRTCQPNSASKRTSTYCSSPASTPSAVKPRRQVSGPRTKAGGRNSTSCVDGAARVPP